MKFTIIFNFLFFYLIVCCFSQSTFSEKKYLFDEVPNNRQVILFDVDNDNDNDLVCVDDDKIYWRENRAGSIFNFDYRAGEGILLNFKHISSFNDITILSALDLNNDNFDDIVLATADSIYIILNQQNGSFSNTNPIDILRNLGFLDLNNDNYPDLFGLSNNKLVWHENNGDGTFGSLNTISENSFTILNQIDLNQDGYLDFIGHSNDTTIWIMNNGDNSFSNEANIYNSPISKIKVIDFDEDNDLDILAVSVQRDTLLFLENENLNFQRNELVYYDNISSYYIQDLINNDDKLDILISNYDGFSTYKNNGNNTFITNQSIVANNANFQLSDLDNDGDLDAISGHEAVSFFENNGNGTFSDAVEIFDPNLLYGIARSDIILMDINSDSLLDINFYYDEDWDNCSNSQAERKTYLNNGNLSFSFHQKYYKPTFVGYFLFDDLDSNGILDEIFAYNDVMRIVPFIGNGDNTDSIVIGQHFYRDGIGQFELNDLNNDGFDDVIGSAYFTHPTFFFLQNLGFQLDLLRWFANSTENTISSPNNGGSTQVIYEECDWNALTLFNEIKEVFVVDIDGDNIDDVLFESYSYGCREGAYYNLAWMKNYQNGQFSTIDSCQDIASVINLNNNFYNPALIPLFNVSEDFLYCKQESKLIYFNTDSFPDIVTIINCEMIIMVNNGNGTFTSDTVENLDLNFESITSGDIDGDGDNDIVCSSNESPNDRIVWLENDGNGNIINTHDIGLGLSREMKTGYINDDNLIDIIYTPRWTNEVIILYNDSTHHFDSTTLFNFEGNIEQIELADLDYNGKTDFIVNSSWPNQLITFEQNSDGEFEEFIIVDSLNYIADFKLGDINGDNFNDLVVSENQDILIYFEYLTNADTTDTVTSVQQNKLVDLNASIYPNPFKEQATLSIKDGKSKNYAIEITDIAGRLVQQFKSKGSNEIILKRGDLTNGIYFLNIYDEVNHLFLVSLKLVID